MALERFLASLPDHADVVRRNLRLVLKGTELTGQQAWGALYIAALADGVAPVIRALEPDARRHLSPEALHAVQRTHASMALNTAYFRAAHGLGGEYMGMRARLHLNLLDPPGVARRDIAFWSLVVAAVNGCSACLDLHEKSLRAGGLPPEHILVGLRIAAVISAAGAVLRAEAAKG